MVRQRDKGEPQEPRKSVADSEEVLRAKYLDYCSARVCDVFMELEEERVFELARAVEDKVGLTQGRLTFRDLAALLVEKLLGDMALPEFEDWAAEYKASPEKYDPYLLGLWKSGIPVDSKQ